MKLITKWKVGPHLKPVLISAHVNNVLDSVSIFKVSNMKRGRQPPVAANTPANLIVYWTSLWHESEEM